VGELIGWLTRCHIGWPSADNPPAASHRAAGRALSANGPNNLWKKRGPVVPDSRTADRRSIYGGVTAYPVHVVAPRYLAQKLTEALPMTDGGVLRTIGDAISYMTALPKQRELQQTWQHACRLILILDGAPIEAITRQLSLALFMDAKLDIGRKLIRAKARV
jgi:hypothetical protein